MYPIIGRLTSHHAGAYTSYSITSLRLTTVRRFRASFGREDSPNSNTSAHQTDHGGPETGHHNTKEEQCRLKERAPPLPPGRPRTLKRRPRRPRLTRNRRSPFSDVERASSFMQAPGGSTPSSPPRLLPRDPFTPPAPSLVIFGRRHSAAPCSRVLILVSPTSRPPATRCAGRALRSVKAFSRRGDVRLALTIIFWAVQLSGPDPSRGSTGRRPAQRSDAGWLLQGSPRVAGASTATAPRYLAGRSRLRVPGRAAHGDY